MPGNPKEIIFDDKAKGKLKKGINLVAEVVSVTLGPKGRNVGISLWSKSKITSDGNSIIDQIDDRDDFVDIGIGFVKDLASKIKQTTADGITTSVIILNEIINEGYKNIAANISPIVIKRGLEIARDEVLKELDKISNKINSAEEIENIAIASASGNKKIGKDIAKAFELATKDGVITVQMGQTTNTEIVKIEGMEIERGYLSAYFCTDVKKMVAELSDPCILVTDKKIHSIQELLPILSSVASKAKELLIIADEIDGDALSTLVINKLKNILKVVAIKTPAYGMQKSQILEDIAHLTGATFITEDKGMFLKDAKFEDLGQASTVQVFKNKTLIVGGQGKNIENRIFELETEKNNIEEEVDKDAVQRRIAKLKGGVVEIRVGSTTDIENREKKQLYEDSLNATKAAAQEGFVIGGGAAFLKASQGLEKLLVNKAEEKIGVDILKKAILKPIEQILKNAGLNPHLIINEILKKGESFGYNVETDQFEDFLITGIIDPVKVLKSSLINAVSVASIILLTDAIIVDQKD
ncbi:MAG: molecular chaperone GroEL [Parachlamydiales bacterium]|nr:molecular chaperone GroEL [Parachlamydiales bacterium]